MFIPSLIMPAAPKNMFVTTELERVVLKSIEAISKELEYDELQRLKGKYSQADFEKALLNLQEKGYISEDENGLMLTDKGRRLL